MPRRRRWVQWQSWQGQASRSEFASISIAVTEAKPVRAFHAVLTCWVAAIASLRIRHVPIETPSALGGFHNPDIDLTSLLSAVAVCVAASRGRRYCLEGSVMIDIDGGAYAH